VVGKIAAAKRRKTPNGVATMIRKTKCRCGNDTYRKGYANSKAAWKCANCSKVTDRREKKTATTELLCRVYKAEFVEV